MAFARKTFSNAAEALDGAKYIDEIAGAIRGGSKTAADLASAKAVYKSKLMKTFADNPGIKKGFGDLLGDADMITPDEFKKIMKSLPDNAADDLFEAGSDAARRADAAKRADDLDLDNIDDLNKLDSLDGPARETAKKALSKKYADMSVDGRKLEGDKFLDAGDEGMEAFKKLPPDARGDLISANPKLRWKTGKQPAGFDWVKGACKNYPKMCVIGATGGLAAAGYASYKIYEKVEEVFDDKEEEKRACIATCLPEDFYESKVSGYGTKDYKDLKFRTVEDVIESSGDNNITAQNTPLCTKSMDPPKKCQQMCVERCDGIHQTFMQRLAKGAGGLARDVVDEASDVAGTGFKGFLDGFFGEGMGIPGAIGIFIFIFIFIIIVSTM